jgi:hypothetical protein
MFGRLRADGHYWARLAPAPGLAIVRTVDLTAPGWDSGVDGGVPALPVSSGTQSLTFTLANGVTVTLRTSGTEPKVKYYAEIALPRAAAAAADAADAGGGGGGDGGVGAARAVLDATVALVVEHCLQPDVHGLVWVR